MLLEIKFSIPVSPVSKNKISAVKDSDFDSIPEGKDECPFSNKEESVSKNGCTHRQLRINTKNKSLA